MHRTHFRALISPFLWAVRTAGLAGDSSTLLHHGLPLKICCHVGLMKWSKNCTSLLVKEIRIYGHHHIVLKKHSTCSNSAQLEPNFKGLSLLFEVVTKYLLTLRERVSFLECLLASFHWTALLQRACTRVPGLLPLDKEQRVLVRGEGNQRGKVIRVKNGLEWKNVMVKRVQMQDTTVQNKVNVHITACLFA